MDKGSKKEKQKDVTGGRSKGERDYVGESVKGREEDSFTHLAISM